MRGKAGEERESSVAIYCLISYYFGFFWLSLFTFYTLRRPSVVCVCAFEGNGDVCIIKRASPVLSATTLLTIGSLPHERHRHLGGFFDRRHESDAHGARRQVCVSVCARTTSVVRGWNGLDLKKKTAPGRGPLTLVFPRQSFGFFFAIVMIRAVRYMMKRKSVAASSFNMPIRPKNPGVMWGSSSSGRASALHAEGTGIDTPLLQHFFCRLSTHVIITRIKMTQKL